MVLTVLHTGGVGHQPEGEEPAGEERGLALSPPHHHAAVQGTEELEAQQGAEPDHSWDGH